MKDRGRDRERKRSRERGREKSRERDNDNPREKQDRYYFHVFMYKSTTQISTSTLSLFLRRQCMKAARDASCIVPIETTASSTESIHSASPPIVMNIFNCRLFAVGKCWLNRGCQCIVQRQNQLETGHVVSYIQCLLVGNTRSTVVSSWCTQAASMRCTFQLNWPSNLLVHCMCTDVARFSAVFYTLTLCISSTCGS